MIDLTGISAALSGLAGVIVALGTVILNRQRQKIVDVDDMEHELELCSEIRGISLRHIRTLERGYADFDQLPPPRPPELRPGYSGRRGANPGRHRPASESDDSAEQSA